MSATITKQTPPAKALAKTVHGRYTHLLTFIILTLFFGLTGLALLLATIAKQAPPGIIVIAFFFGFIAYLIAYTTIVAFPRKVEFEDRQIIWHGLGYRRQFPASELQALLFRKQTYQHRGQTNTQLWLVLRLRNGQEVTLMQRYVQESLQDWLLALAEFYKLEVEPGRYEELVHYRQFAMGSDKPFHWYFTGRSQVPVNTIEDICHWLRQCEYVQDKVQFGKKDHWQHPTDELEQNRKGDCEDFALWAWRKLAELNISAELVVGKHPANGPESTPHAWVVYRSGREQFLLEPTAKTIPMIIPLQATNNYRPRYGVDHHYKTYSYEQNDRPGKNGADPTT